MKTYDNLKESLRIAVMEEARSQDVIANTLYREADNGFVAVPYFNNGEETVWVTNEMLEEWSNEEALDSSQVIDDAIANNRQYESAYIDSLESTIHKLLSFEENPSQNILSGPALTLDSNETMFVVSNESKLYGASSYFVYPEVQERIADAMNSNYFVLPSSKHEVIVLKDNNSIDPNELLDMVAGINSSEVSAQDQLADKVFHYDAAERQLSVIAERAPETSKLYYWDEPGLEEELEEEPEI